MIWVRKWNRVHCPIPDIAASRSITRTPQTEEIWHKMYRPGKVKQFSGMLLITLAAFTKKKKTTVVFKIHLILNVFQVLIVSLT